MWGRGIVSLRIVSWNCCGGFKNKAPRLAQLNPDIAVIPEVLREHATALGETYHTVWDGNEGQKGLLLAAREPWRIELAGRSAARHMVRAELSLGDRRLTVVGVWAMPGDAGYNDTLVRGLDDLLPSITGEDIIVAGDFNASPVFDKADRLGDVQNGFDQIHRRLRARGLESAWHAFRSDGIGTESVSTYHHRRKRDERFHIDYIFLSQGLSSGVTAADIGKYEDWCVPDGGSDHTPLTVDVRLEL
ncbi:MAG: endonuclease/exonuclease/phosphatase family protein [Burkholderiales bacterium]|nr:MAG: endonuclease/exonuclease/phosphatase family protein [Burkholderiales bacterium]